MGDDWRARLAAEDAREEELRAAGLREFVCRIWTEPVEGDLESWRLALGEVMYQRDLVRGVRVNSSTVDPHRTRVVVNATVEAKTGHHALELITRWLRCCGEQDNTMQVRRIELYPFEDDGDRKDEIHDEVIDDLRADAEGDNDPAEHG
jgi:hypothetical protein